MLLITYFIMLASVVNAMNYYGEVPMINDYHGIEKYKDSLAKEGIKILSLYRSSKVDTDSMFRFLASGGFVDPKITDNNTIPHMYSINSIESASKIQTSCDGDAIALSQEAQYNICNVLNGVSLGTIATIGYIIQSAKCSEAKTGHPIRCNALIIFGTTSGATISGGAITMYCPKLLSLIKTKCKNRGGASTITSTDYTLVQDLTQKKEVCSYPPDYPGACTTTTYTG